MKGRVQGCMGIYSKQAKHSHMGQLNEKLACNAIYKSPENLE